MTQAGLSLTVHFHGMQNAFGFVLIKDEEEILDEGNGLTSDNPSWIALGKAVRKIIEKYEPESLFIVGARVTIDELTGKQPCPNLRTAAIRDRCRELFQAIRVKTKNIVLKIRQPGGVWIAQQLCMLALEEEQQRNVA